MKKLIILRGHQGSGKSTYAKQLLKGFKLSYEGASTFEVSYDDTLIRQNNGKYDWSPEHINAAMEAAWQDYMSFVKQHIRKNENVLVVHSATNRTLKAFRKYMDFAKARGYEVEIIRLSDFYENEHNCSNEVVAETFIALEQNPIEGEVILPCTVPPKGELLKAIDRLRKASVPQLNEQNGSYVTEDYLIYNKGKIRASRSKKYPELRTFKYSNKVFFDNEFDNAMLELRGLVLDDDCNMVVRPFIKAFNLSERQAKDSKFPLSVNGSDRFNAIKKINGYLGCATYVDRKEFEGKGFNKQVLYSTTGSLDSWFAEVAKEHLQKYECLFRMRPNHTFMFEIVDERDPHIIPEKAGEYLLACKSVFSGEMIPPTELRPLVAKMKDINSVFSGITFPEIFFDVSFDEIIEMNQEAKFEGFVVYDRDFKEIIFKLKSPYYLITKFLGRKKDLDKMLKELSRHNLNGGFINKYSIDEEYFPLIEHLSNNIDEVLALDEQGRIEYIRNFLENPKLEKER